MIFKYDNPAIALFAYNRPLHFEKTIISLSKNYNINEFDLYIFIDGPKNEDDIYKSKIIKKIIKKTKKFNNINIIESKKNKGLKNSIISGVAKIFESYKKIIVLEDDVLTSRYFINYMRNALNFYENNELIGTVSGYSFINPEENYLENFYLSQRHASWGWGTWKENWDNLNWNRNWALDFLNDVDFKKKFNNAGEDMYHILDQQMKNKINSWAIIYNLNCFFNKQYCLCPRKGMVFNIGMDGTGVHCKKDDTVFSNFDPNFNVDKFHKIKTNINIMKKINKSFHTPIYKRVINKINKIFKN
jgi:hypothetical protein